MSVNLKPQKFTILGVSNSGKTCLVGALVKAFCNDNKKNMITLQGDSDDIKTSQMQINRLIRFAPDMGYPSETRGLTPQTIRLNKSSGKTLLAFSLYDYRGGGLTDFSEGTDDADFGRIMDDLYDSETILVVLDSLIIKHHPLKKWRKITAAEAINRVLIELQSKYPNRKYNIIVVFTKFEASILYDTVSKTAVRTKQKELLAVLVDSTKKVFNVFDTPKSKKHWAVSYIPVDVVGLGNEETISQDVEYHIGGVSFDGYKFGSRISDDNDVKPFNLDFFGCYLFASMLNNRIERILEENTFLYNCENAAQKLEKSNKDLEYAQKMLADLSNVKNGSWWQRLVHLWEHEEFVSTTLERNRNTMSRKIDAIEQDEKTLTSNKERKLPSARDHILRFDDNSWYNADSHTFSAMRKAVKIMHDEIKSAHNDITKNLPSGLISE